MKSFSSDAGDLPFKKLPKYFDRRSANYALLNIVDPKMSIQKRRSKHVNQKTSIQKRRSKNISPKTLIRKRRFENVGPKMLIRKRRSEKVNPKMSIQKTSIQKNVVIFPNEPNNVAMKSWRSTAPLCLVVVPTSAFCPEVLMRNLIPGCQRFMMRSSL